MSQQYLYDIKFIKNMGMKNDQSTITLNSFMVQIQKISNTNDLGESNYKILSGQQNSFRLYKKVCCL